MINRRRVSRPKNYVPKPRICPFCTEGINIDYKDVSRLSQYISGRGKIESRRRTRACAKHQRKLAQAVKRARFLALLPFAPSHIWKTGVDLRQPMS